MAKDKITEPGFWEPANEIGTDLTPKPPSLQYAGDLGAKYGDVKTASWGGPVDAIKAVFAPSGLSGIKRSTTKVSVEK